MFRDLDPATREEARRLRANKLSLDHIAKELGISTRMVKLATKDMAVEVYDIEWRPKARELRAQGLSIRDITAAVGRGETQVREAVKGVVCPVNHIAVAARQASLRNNDMSWVDQARQLRVEGKSLAELATLFNRSQSRIGKVTRDVGCPVDHLKAARRENVRVAMAEKLRIAREQAQIRRERQEKERQERLAERERRKAEQKAEKQKEAKRRQEELVARRLHVAEVARQNQVARIITHATKLPAQPKLTKAEKRHQARMTTLRNLLNQDNTRVRSPITLPRVSILEHECD